MIILKNIKYLDRVSPFFLKGYQIVKAFCVLIFFTTLFSGCAIQTKLQPKSYQGSVSARSNVAVSVEKKIGKISSDSLTMQIQVNGNFTPITTNSPDSFNFDEEDQNIFITHLESELVRLGLFNAKTIEGSSTIQVIIEFRSTYFDPSINQYILDVVMHVYRGDQELRSSKYHIDSSEGDSYWDKVNATGPAAKTETSNKLQKSIILDLGKWISNNDIPQ